MPCFNPKQLHNIDWEDDDDDACFSICRHRIHTATLFSIFDIQPNAPRTHTEIRLSSEILARAAQTANIIHAHLWLIISSSLGSLDKSRGVGKDGGMPHTLFLLLEDDQ